MGDAMSRAAVDVTKPINLDQLSAEVGAGLCASLDDTDAVTRIVAAEDANVTADALVAALDAHVPDPDYGQPDEDRQLRALRTKAREVAAGNGTFTAAQVQKILAHLILRSTR